MDANVVDTEKTARDCIQYMRENMLCVATFIPLDAIRAKPVPDRLRTLHKGARPAIDTLAYGRTDARIALGERSASVVTMRPHAVLGDVGAAGPQV